MHPKPLLLALVFLASFGVAQTPEPPQRSKEPLQPGTYSVDSKHAWVSFDVEHLGISRIEGRFTDVDGKIVIDPKRMERSSMTLRIKVASASTGVADYDALIGTKEFFDTARSPEILFVSKRVWKNRRDYVAEGDLTMRGVTHEVRILFNAYGSTEVGEALGNVRLGLISKPLRLDRRDYGVPYNVRLRSGIPQVGYGVNVRFSMEAVRDK